MNDIEVKTKSVKEKRMCRFDLDLTGKQFNRWTVIRKSEKTKHTKRGNYTLWECKCSCGNPKTFYIPTVSLEHGYSKSCGCLQKEIASERNQKRIYEEIARTGIIANWKILFKTKKNLWKCECLSCGNTQEIEGGKIKYRKCDKCKENKITENDNRLVGKTIGFLTVLSKTNKIYHGTSCYYFKCHCNKCDKDCEKPGAYLIREMSKKVSFVNCGCFTKNSIRVSRVMPKIRKNNTSGITGVSFDNTRKKYKADIRANGIMHSLGRYDTLGEAALARQLAEQIYHRPILEKVFDDKEINNMYKESYIQKPREFKKLVQYTWSRGINVMDIEIGKLIKDFEYYRNTSH